jgi:branched-chain amino acid transport system ATP-binding protein
MPDGLRLAEVRAGYGETVVLEDIAFSLPERGSLAVLGRNGVGKSTLLSTVIGHTTFHSGTIEYQGRSIAGLPAYERVRLGIGYVPQEREIFPSLTVEENLTVAARPFDKLRTGPSTPLRTGREPWTLERVYELFPGIERRRGHMGNQISGGEQQMLAIGRALMGNPTLLLMDEPLEGLAPIIIESLLRTLARLIREESLTVILVEQHAKLALAVTQDALVLNRGRISYLGTSAELRDDPQRLTSLIVAT